MNLNPSRRVRAAIYVANVIGAPLVGYAVAKGWIGPTEVALWSGEVAGGFLLAGLNTPAPPAPPEA